MVEVLESFSVIVKFLVIFFLCFSSLILTVSAKSQFQIVHQKADQLEYDDKSKIMRLDGHVVIWQGKMILKCSHATYYLKSQEATAYGRLKLISPHGIITGKKLRVYYNKKIAFVYGNVVLVYHPKNKKGEQKGPITMTSNSLEYEWGKKIAVAKGDVVLTQKGRIAKGDHAIFEKRSETLIMDGHVSLFRPPKNRLLCDHLIYHLKTDSAVAKGNVQAVFLVKKESKTAAMDHRVQSDKNAPAVPQKPFLDDRAWSFS